VAVDPVAVVTGVTDAADGADSSGKAPKCIILDAMVSVPRYGVKEQQISPTAVDRAVEQLALAGCAVVDGGYTAVEIEAFARAFETARTEAAERHGGRARLEALDEHNTIRVPMLYDRLFLRLAANETILAICRRMIGEYITLSQQNGVINPGGGGRYNQGAYHRDLPYQHFVSSRPLAINALFCLDEFTIDNGATFVVPGSHKQEAFPSDAVVQALQTQMIAPAGSFIVLDAMLFHSGATNRTDRDRRAVNHVFTAPIIKPQIDLPSVLGDGFTDVPELRQLLGYDVRVPLSLEDYYQGRAARVKPLENS
jgi:ectoine hydroxylase-related dioxygenase (phytanoyl-CoA dioxygenase family)